MDNLSTSDLAAFQLAFLNAISKWDNPCVIKKSLQNDPRLLVFRTYIDEMDNKMIAVCVELSRKYGKSIVHGEN
jgi:hypothetical protein